MNFKTIFFISLTLFSVSNQNYGSDEQARQAEKDFRQRYNNLKFPKFTFDPRHSYHHDDGTNEVFKDTLFNAGDRVIDWLDGEKTFSESLKNIWNYKASRHEPIINSELGVSHFKLLHEKGHNDLAEKGLTSINSLKINTGVVATTFMLWGKHKNQPYKNICTKLGSKAIAAISAGVLINNATRRFHEVYADNYACKHVKDKKALELVRNELADQVATSKQLWNQLGVPVLFGKVIEFCDDPYHPLAQSRLAKIEKTIKSKFSD